MSNLTQIGKELFNKLRSRFPKITIGDTDGKVTNDPELARFFDFEYSPDEKISISIDEEKGMTVMYSADVAENNSKTWYDFLKEMRKFAKKRLLDFNVRDITKSNLNKRDFNYLSTEQVGEDTMNESKMYGTSKISYQDIGDARLVLKHKKHVDAENPVTRTQNVERIYIESSNGERFLYPYKHLAGARAMARHVAEGGVAYDNFGKHITGLSEELSKLRQFKTHINRNSVMAETLSQYTDIVAERVEEIKTRLKGLQRKDFYAEQTEQFEEAVFEDVPEDVRNNWIEELTIKHFNEDLQEVFPYIYKLVNEKSQPKELGPEDLLGEGMDPEEFKQKVADSGDAGYDMLSDALNGKYGPNVQREIEKRYEDIVDGAGLHPDDDYEGILDRMMDGFEEDYGDDYAANQDDNDDFDYRQEYDDDSMDDMIDFESSINELMGQFGEAENNNVLATLQDIVDNKQAQKVNLDGRTTMVDMFTASAIMQVYNAVNDANKKKIEDALKTQTGFMKIADFAMSKAGKSESLEEMDDDDQDEFHRAIHAKLGGDPDKFVPFAQRPKDGEHVELKFPKRYERAMEVVKDAFAKITGIDSNKIDVDLTKGDRTVMIDGETPHPAILSALNGTLDKLDTGEIRGMYSEEETTESGLQYHIGKKKYGKDGMAKLAQAGREGASEQELGKIKDQYKKENRDELPFEPDDKTVDKDKFGNTIKKKNLPKHLAKKGMAKAKEKTPLSEFILSYFDRETGQFPKGETAVLTMIEKDYGDEYIKPAKQFIESVKSKVAEMYGYKDDKSKEGTELERIRGLAGL